MKSNPLKKTEPSLPSRSAANQPVTVQAKVTTGMTGKSKPRSKSRSGYDRSHINVQFNSPVPVQLKTGIPVNDDKGLEREATIMSKKALENITSPTNLSPLQQIAADGPLQMVKLGAELTFSDDTLSHMALTEADYKKNPLLDPRWKNEISYGAYNKLVKTNYITEWASAVKENNSEKENIKLSVKKGAEGKGADVELNKVFKYAFTPEKPSEVSTPEKTIGETSTTSPPVQTPGEMTSMEKPPAPEKLTPDISSGQPSPSLVPSLAKPSEKKEAPLPPNWWWDIDIDPMCLEIRAEAVDYEVYRHPAIAQIIQEDIFDVALNKLKLQTGYAGRGGGHISVDYETGFDSNPVNVAKTVAFVEIIQKKIDTLIALVDVTDDKNAPYLFDASRAQGLGAISEWLQAALVPSPSKPEESSAPLVPVGKTKKEKKGAEKKTAPVGSDWNNKLMQLAVLLQKFPASAQDANKQLKPKGRNWHVPLHYQNINLEHTRDTDGEHFEKKEQRVEFRRLVAQRSYGELIWVMDMVLTWIREATAIAPEELSRKIRSQKAVEKIMRSKEFIEKNKIQAAVITDQDEKGIIPKAPELPEVKSSPEKSAPKEEKLQPHDEKDYARTIKENQSTLKPTVPLEKNAGHVYTEYPLTPQQLLKLGTKKILPTVPDGDCSINAVFESLGEPVDPRLYRVQIADWLLSKKRITSSEAKNITKPGDSSKSDLMLDAMANLLQIQIILIDTNGNESPIIPEAHDKTITLFHNPSGAGHFYGTN